MHADPVAIAQDLIRCPSVTPAEAGALAYLEGVLAPAGFAVERPVFSEPGTEDVENLYAILGESGPTLAFAGHTDVVPAGPEADWTHPPFGAEIAGGRLYGRGAADMKGGIAAFVAAALDWAAAKPRRGRIAFLITGDEEGLSVNGTVKLLKWAAERGERWDGAIVGEPTNPERLGQAIKVGRRGSVSGTLTVTGKQGHSANPHNADNPIPRLVAGLSALIGERFDEGTERFIPTRLEVTSVDVGNPAHNVIPAKITARFNTRFNDRWTYETLTERFRALLDGAIGAGRYSLAFEPFNSPSFLTRADALIAPLSAAIEAETGLRPELSTTGGTSDARFIKDYCPVVEFGLVGKTIHQIDEHVAVDDIRTLARIYRGFIDRFFAAG